ncbi:hypothetical protein B0H14DRAFT_3438550 [Mycena olivaceomarginata]|nr:hypothetical protein B0H14DRAFT_3438550 [Mycena olivaceomarginata]
MAQISGGKGGQGGQGSSQGGKGGFVGAPRISASDAHHFLEIHDGKRGLDGSLSEEISRLLQEKGFETPRMLLEVDDGALRSAGLEGGHITEVQTALREFLTQAQP